jgi:hypothetical protein
MELAYDDYLSATPSSNGNDPDGDWLIAELRFLLSLPQHPLGSQRVVDDWIWLAQIHARRREFHEHVHALFKATQFRESDLDILCRYGMSLQYLQGRGDPDTDREVAAKLPLLVDGALFVIKQKREAEILDEDDVTTWTELFQSLLHR